MKRFVLSVLLTPLIISILVGLAEATFAGRMPNMKLMMGLIPVFYIFTLLGLIVLGLPIYFLLKKTNYLNLFSLVIAGGLSGIVYMILFTLILSGKSTPFDWSSAWPGLLMGASSACVFGVLAGIPIIRK